MTTSRRALPLVVILLIAFGSLGWVLVRGWAPALGLDLQGGISVVFTAAEADGDGATTTTTTSLPEVTTTTAEPVGPTSPEDTTTTEATSTTTTTEATTTTAAPDEGDEGDERDIDLDQALDDAIGIIRNRVDSLGVAEPEILRQGNAIVVNLPGITDRERALEIIGRTAELRFRPVLSIQPYITADDLEPAETTTTGPGETTTTEAGDTTTSTAGDGTTSTSTTTTTVETGGDDEGAVAPLSAQVTTTTAPGITTTTAADGETTTTEPGATTTTAAGDTTTSTLPEEIDGCALLGGTTPPEQDTLDATVVLPSTDRNGDGRPDACYQLGPVPTDDRGPLVGSVVTNPEAQINQGQWGVSLGIRSASLPLFNSVASSCYVGGPTCPSQDESGRGRLAIVLDGVVESAPSIDEPAFSGDGLVISGNMTERDARDLALVLRYGALPIELEAQTVQSVSATLGEDSLRAGLVAGLIGVGLVFLYLFVYYRALGLVVVAGTLVWSALNYAVIAWLGETRGLALTLSGVTGIVISVGVTVDSYVVYFERLKDEMRSGRTVRASIDRGFQRAFRTILAANVSSLIGAAFLFALTVGPVRGFAFFLGLSTLLGVVVAWFFTRPLMSLLGRTHLFTDHPVLGVGRGLGPARGSEAGS